MPNNESAAPNISLGRLLNMRRSNAEQLNNVPLQAGSAQFHETNYIEKNSGMGNTQRLDNRFKQNVS